MTATTKIERDGWDAAACKPPAYKLVHTGSTRVTESGRLIVDRAEDLAAAMAHWQHANAGYAITIYASENEPCVALWRRDVSCE